MNKKQNKGITLVALVITIIVLIILAGVSINAIMNEGLITNSKNAKDKWVSKSAIEELGIAELDGMLEVETLGTIKAGESAGTDNKKYTDSTGKTAVIPAGFTVSNIIGENTISGGLVIYSMDATTAAGVNWTTGKDTSGNIIQEKYNQYVWIPVENPSDMYGILESPVEGIEGIKFGKLYFKNKTDASSKYNWPEGGDVAYSKTDYREPAVLSSFDTDSKYYKDILGYSDVNAYKAGMVQEFNDMITSVEKYKGFYIGRYELTSSDGTVNTANVVKEKMPINYTNWYNLYKACINLEAGNANAKDKVRTTMIWGCQWDQAVKKCLVFDDKFLTDNSAKYGVYSGNGTSGVQVSGTKDAAYNIYDMGGNVWDWTLESDYALYRTSRGSYHNGNSTSESASSRHNSARPTYEVHGCRSQLYIK